MKEGECDDVIESDMVNHEYLSWAAAAAAAAPDGWQTDRQTGQSRLEEPIEARGLVCVCTL